MPDRGVRRADALPMSSKQQASNKQLAPQGPFWAPEQKRSRNRKKCYHGIRDGFPQLSRDFFFFSRTPRWSQSVIYWGFGLFCAAGTYRNFGPRSKTEKRNFPELEALLGKKSVHPKSFSQKWHNFFTVCVFAERTPRGGKSQNIGFVCPFGLGQPLGT